MTDTSFSEQVLKQTPNKRQKSLSHEEDNWWQTSNEPQQDFDSSLASGLDRLDSEISEMLDLKEGLGLTLLINLINELVSSPVEIASGEVLLQPILSSIIASKCFTHNKALSEIGLQKHFDPYLLGEPLLNFQLDTRWYPWLSPCQAFDDTETILLEKDGNRLTLRKLGTHLVYVKALSLQNHYPLAQDMPVLADAVDSCVRVLSRYLLRQTGKSIKGLSRLPAIFNADADHVNLTFDAKNVGRFLAQAGLDKNPYKVAWLDKGIKIHIHDSDYV